MTKKLSDIIPLQRLISEIMEHDDRFEIMHKQMEISTTIHQRSELFFFAFLTGKMKEAHWQVCKDNDFYGVTKKDFDFVYPEQCKILYDNLPDG